MQPFEITLICAASGAIVAWLWSLHKVKMMEHSLDTATCRIKKRTEALHNLEKLIENSILVFSQLEAFAEKTLDGLAIIKNVDKKDSHFVYANPAMSETLGYTQDELISRPWREFLVEDKNNVFYEEVTKALATGKAVRRVLGEYKCKDGSKKLLSVSSCPADEDGFIYAVFREIS
jgi:PAS domain S-box-containing protein